MQGIKPWQIAIIVLGLIVGIGSVVWQVASGGPPKMATRLTFVDVESGELYLVDRPSDVTLSPPLTNPKTNVRSLYPATKDGDGWAVAFNFRDGLKAEMKAVADVRSGRIKTVGEPKPIKITFK